MHYPYAMPLKVLPETKKTNEAERRRFQRLPLSIPLFLRGVDSEGKEFLDFTVAVDISAGGALVATRRVISRSSWLYLEMPTAPVPLAGFPNKPKRAMAGRVVRTKDKGTYYLCAVKFPRPLV
jgi:hypothetical protein